MPSTQGQAVMFDQPRVCESGYSTFGRRAVLVIGKSLASAGAVILPAAADGQGESSDVARDRRAARSGVRGMVQLEASATMVRAEGIQGRDLRDRRPRRRRVAFDRP